MLKDTNYVIIPAWAINHLELSPTELIIYSVIYGFSQDGESEYRGSARYLSEITKTSLRTVMTGLKSLVGKGYVNKIEHRENGVSLPRYADCISHKFTGVCNGFTGGYENSAHHNTSVDTTSSVKEEKENPPSCCGNASGDSDTNEVLLIDNKDSTPKRKKKSIEIPTLQECIDYANAMKLVIDPYEFHSYYEEMKWHDLGGKPVANWKLRMHSWNARDKHNRKVGSKSHNTSSDDMQIKQIAEARKRHGEDTDGIF